MIGDRGLRIRDQENVLTFLTSSQREQFSELRTDATGRINSRGCVLNLFQNLEAPPGETPTLRLDMVGEPDHPSRAGDSPSNFASLLILRLTL